MDMCIRCNPISELLTADDGTKSCRYHGANYILEVWPDAQRVDTAPVADVPVPDVPEVA